MSWARRPTCHPIHHAKFQTAAVHGSHFLLYLESSNNDATNALLLCRRSTGLVSSSRAHEASSISVSITIQYIIFKLALRRLGSRGPGARFRTQRLASMIGRRIATFDWSALLPFGLQLFSVAAHHPVDVFEETRPQTHWQAWTAVVYSPTPHQYSILERRIAQGCWAASL